MTRCLIRAAVLICLLPCCRVGVAAQAAGTLAGTVTDGRGALVVGAQVRALGADGLAEASARTDSASRYALTNLPPGKVAMILKWIEAGAPPARK